MPNWLATTVLSTLLFAIYPIFGTKAGKVHGSNMNFVLYGCVFLVFSLTFLAVYREDINLITKRSLVFGLLMGVFVCSAVILMLRAWQLAPTQLPKIMITIGFSTVILAVISNFTDPEAKLKPSDWFWVAGSTVCITGLHWKS